MINTVLSDSIEKTKCRRVTKGLEMPQKMLFIKLLRNRTHKEAEQDIKEVN